MSTTRHSGSGNYSYRNSGNNEDGRDRFRNTYRAPRHYYSSNNQNRDRNDYRQSQDVSRRNQGPNYYQNEGGAQQQQHDYQSRSRRQNRRDQSSSDQESRSETPPNHGNQTDDDIVKSYMYMKPNLIIGQIRKVILDQFASKDRFVCRLSDDGSLTELMQELQQECNNGQYMNEIFNFGEICVAQFVHDGVWHRGIVMRVEQEQYCILGLDTGICDSIPLSNVRGMKRKFCSLPRQAFICKLDGAELDWSDEDNSLFERYSESGNWICWFKNAPENDLHSVVLFLEEQFTRISNPHTVLDMLREKAASAEIKADPKSVVCEDTAEGQPCEVLVLKHEGSPLFSHFTSLVKTVKEAEEVIISWVVSEYEFYCNLKMDADRVDELNENLQSVYANEKGDGLKLQQLTPGTCCVAKFYTDEWWYRAEIQKVDGNEAQVLFVDYGNVEFVNVDDLRQITEEFVQLPAQAVHCVIPSVNHGRKLTSADVDSEAAYYFLSCNDRCYKVEESNNNNNEGGHQEVAYNEDLEPDEQNREDQIPESGNAVKVCEDALEFEVETGMEGDHMLNVQSEVEDVEAVDGEEAAVEIGELCEAIKRTDLDYKPESCTMFDLPRSRTQVYVLEPATSPVDFWVQISDHTCDLLDKVGNVDDIARMPLADVIEGVVCASTYNEDGAWYRAKVIAKHPNSTSTILYIDYGNTEIMHDTQLFTLEEDIARIFPHAVHCQLSNILLDSSQTPKALEKFVEMTDYYAKMLLVEFLDVDTIPYPVRLLDCGIDVAKTLADLGLCTYVEEIKKERRVGSCEKDDEESESAVDRTYSIDDEDSFLVCSDAISGIQDNGTEIVSVVGDEELIPSVVSETDMNAELNSEVFALPVSENIVGIDEISSLEIIHHNPNISEVFDPSLDKSSVSEAHSKDDIGGGYFDENAETVPESSIQVVCLDCTGEVNLNDTEELCKMIRELECANDSCETPNSTYSAGTDDILNSSSESHQLQDDTSLRDPGISINSDSIESTPSVGIDDVCEFAKPQVLPCDTVTAAEQISDNAAEIHPLPVDVLDETRNEHSPRESEFEENNTDNEDVSNAEAEMHPLPVVVLDETLNEPSPREFEEINPDNEDVSHGKGESVGSNVCLDIPNVQSSEVPVDVDCFAKCEDTSASVVSRCDTCKDGEECNVEESTVDISQTSDSLNEDCCEEDMFNSSDSIMYTSIDANENGSSGNTSSRYDRKEIQLSVEFDFSFPDASSSSSNGMRDTPRKLITRLILSSDQEFDSDEIQIVGDSQSETGPITSDESLVTTCDSKDSKSPTSCMGNTLNDTDEFLGEAKAESSDDFGADSNTYDSSVEVVDLVKKDEAVSTSEDDGNACKDCIVEDDTDDEMSQKLEVDVGEVKTSEDEDSQESDGTSSAKDFGSSVLIEDSEDESSEGSSSTSEDNDLKEMSDADEDDERKSEDENVNGYAMMTGSESEEDSQPCDDAKNIETSESDDDDVYETSVEKLNGDVLTSTESENERTGDEEESSTEDKVKSISETSDQEEVCDVEVTGTSATFATTSSNSNDSDQEMVCDDDDDEVEDKESSSKVDISSCDGSREELVLSKLECKGSSISDEVKSSVSEDEESFAGDAEDEYSSRVSEEECFVSESGCQNEEVSSSDLEAASNDDAKDDVSCYVKDQVDDYDDCKEMACSALEGDGDKDVEFSAGEEDFFSSSDKVEDDKSDVCFEEISSISTQPNQDETCCDFESENAHIANNNSSVVQEVQESSEVPSNQLDTPADEEM